MLDKSDKIKDYIVVSLSACFLFGLLLYGILKPDIDISASERRPLAKLPKLSWETLLNGKFMTDFEDYSMDQFPFRDGFRAAKAIAARFVFGQKDTNKIYVADGYISQLEYPLDMTSLDHAAERFENIYGKYLKDKNCDIYYSIIPDKNYFLAAAGGYPSFDYEEMERYFAEKCTYMEYIDIFDCLEIDDYYKTDTHWRQEEIIPVAEKLAEAMGNPIATEATSDSTSALSGHPGMKYEKKALSKPFYGVYYGQAALPVKADEIFYLENDTINNLEVFDYETNRAIPVYDMELANGKDPYEMFLSGPKSYIKITNPNATSGKKLIIFRDSFGSSIAPLLAVGYEEILLLDIRYLSSELLGRLVDFEDHDVLFLYSSLVLNNSITMK